MKWIGLKWTRSIAIVLLVVAVPVVGSWLRRSADVGCAMDGVPVPALFAARVVDETGKSHRFCCITCAAEWARVGEVAAAYVMDEAGSGEIDVSSAYFVRSRVVTNAVTGNRVHAFRLEADAVAHARTFAGVILAGAERLFTALRDLPQS